MQEKRAGIAGSAGVEVGSEGGLGVVFSRQQRLIATGAHGSGRREEKRLWYAYAPMAALYQTQPGGQVAREPGAAEAQATGCRLRPKKIP
jgi:hypothetical protein